MQVFDSLGVIRIPHMQQRLKGMLYRDEKSIHFVSLEEGWVKTCFVVRNHRLVYSRMSRGAHMVFLLHMIIFFFSWGTIDLWLKQNI
jgi:hypothetical protein